MSPVIPVAFITVLYLIVACVVWIVAGVLSLHSSTRTLGRKMAWGIVGSFPGVILFLIVSAPVFVLAILSVNFVCLSGRPRSLILVCVASSVVCIPLAASLLGFYTGWRIAWERAVGRPARVLFQSDPILKPITRNLVKCLKYSRFLASGATIWLCVLLGCVIYPAVELIPTLNLTRSKQQAIVDTIERSRVVHGSSVVKWICTLDCFLTDDVGRYNPVFFVKSYEDMTNNTINYIFAEPRATDSWLVYEVKKDAWFPHNKFYFGLEATP